MILHVRIALMRRSASGFEILLVRRPGEGDQFPGGPAHDGEDARVAAARTLFEDCGILLARDAGQAAETLEMPTFGVLRKKIREGANATQLFRAHGLTWASEALLPWSHWLTPSIEAVRTATRLFLAEIPAGMRTLFDPTENAGETWLAPGELEAHGDALQLSPMFVRTCWELARHVSVPSAFAAARKRAEEAHPILPRLAAREDSRCLLLPWDPDYETRGQGESHPFTHLPAWATGPSRFVLEDRTWKHVPAPGSTSAG